MEFHISFKRLHFIYVSRFKCIIVRTLSDSLLKKIRFKRVKSHFVSRVHKNINFHKHPQLSYPSIRFDNNIFPVSIYMLLHFVSNLTSHFLTSFSPFTFLSSNLTSRAFLKVKNYFVSQMQVCPYCLCRHVYVCVFLSQEHHHLSLRRRSMRFKRWTHYLMIALRGTTMRWMLHLSNDTTRKMNYTTAWNFAEPTRRRKKHTTLRKPDAFVSERPLTKLAIPHFARILLPLLFAVSLEGRTV